MSAAAPKKSYLELAKEAIAALKERTGSSPQAIKAYITSNHPSIKFAQHLLRTALNKGVETGKFIKVKASFKLAASEKKAPKKVVVAPTVVKKATPAAPKKAKAAPAAGIKHAATSTQRLILTDTINDTITAVYLTFNYHDITFSS
jgi:histone H1/5